MSKLKFITVFTAAALAVWLAAAAALSVPYYYGVQSQLETDVSRWNHTAQTAFAQTETPEDALRAFIKDSGGALESDHPYVAAVFDIKGNRLAETRDTLFATLGANTSFEREVTVDLQPYITQAHLDELAAFTRAGFGSPLLVKEAAFRQWGDTLTPVSLTLDYGDFSGRALTLSFTSEESNVRTSYNDASVCVFDTHKSRVMEKRLAAMRAAFPKIGAEIAELTEQEFYDIGLLYLSMENVGLNAVPVTQGDQTLYFILLSTCRPVVYTLSLAGTRLMFLTLAAAFLYTVALILALRLRRSRASLAHSRYSFLSAAAHELKTPLSVITSAGECIVSDVAPEKNGQYAAMILQESARMQSLVEQMLRQNRFLSAESVNKTPTDLSALVLRETAKYEAAAAQKHITLQTAVEEGLRIRCDADMIAVALDNYLSNAVKYAPEHAGITVRAAREGRRIGVYVHNTGSRISETALPHIWEELYREDAVRGEGSGSGLGLSICRRIFELHRFYYGCTSTDEGTLFRFTAPAFGIKNTAVRKPEKTRSGRLSPAEGYAAATVLLVSLGLALVCYAMNVAVNMVLLIGTGLASAGVLSGLLSILLAILARRDGKKNVRRWPIILAAVFLLLPPLALAFFWLAGANGW